MDISLEMYFENGMYHAFICADGASGIKVDGNTPEELIANATPYLLDAAKEIETE